MNPSILFPFLTGKFKAVVLSKWHPFNAEGTPLPVSSDATKTCVISLSEKICEIAAICREESVPDGEKIISDSELRSYFASIDTNGDGVLSFEEFRAAGLTTQSF